jgi:hypothetical protein
MASLVNLLARLHEQGWVMLSEDHAGEDLEQYLRAWVALNRHAGRLAAQVGGDYRPVSLLVDQATEGLSAGDVDRRMAGMSLTIGAIADLLVIRNGEVALVGPEARSRVEASVMAGVYAAARTTYECARGSDRSEVAAVMRRISGLTEVAAMVPPGQLRGPLDFVVVPDRSVHTLDGAVRAWRHQALTTLDSPWLVTEHALRSAAGDVNFLLQAAGRALDSSVEAGVVDVRDAGDARVQLGLAAAAWQAATRWPQHLRLGGRSVSLRRSAGYLRQSLEPGRVEVDPAAQLTAIGGALAAAQGVAAYHERALARLVRRGGLWVHASHLTGDEVAQAGASRSGWVVKPRGSEYGRELLHSSSQAQKRLGEAVEALLSVPMDRGFDGQMSRWETVEPPRLNRRRDQASVEVTRPPAVAR